MASKIPRPCSTTTSAKTIRPTAVPRTSSNPPKSSSALASPRSGISKPDHLSAQGNGEMDQKNQTQRKSISSLSSLKPAPRFRTNRVDQVSFIPKPRITPKASEINGISAKSAKSLTTDADEAVIDTTEASSALLGIIMPSADHDLSKVQTSDVLKTSAEALEESQECNPTAEIIFCGSTGTGATNVSHGSVDALENLVAETVINNSDTTITSTSTTLHCNAQLKSLSPETVALPDLDLNLHEPISQVLSPTISNKSADGNAGDGDTVEKLKEAISDMTSTIANHDLTTLQSAITSNENEMHPVAWNRNVMSQTSSATLGNDWDSIYVFETHTKDQFQFSLNDVITNNNGGTNDQNLEFLQICCNKDAMSQTSSASLSNDGESAYEFETDTTDYNTDAGTGVENKELLFSPNDVITNNNGDMASNVSNPDLNTTTSTATSNVSNDQNLDIFRPYCNCNNKNVMSQTSRVSFYENDSANSATLPPTATTLLSNASKDQGKPSLNQLNPFWGILTNEISPSVCCHQDAMSQTSEVTFHNSAGNDECKTVAGESNRAVQSHQNEGAHDLPKPDNTLKTEDMKPVEEWTWLKLAPAQTVIPEVFSEEEAEESAFNYDTETDYTTDGGAGTGNNEFLFELCLKEASHDTGDESVKACSISSKKKKIKTIFRVDRPLSPSQVSTNGGGQYGDGYGILPSKPTSLPMYCEESLSKENLTESSSILQDMETLMYEDSGDRAKEVKERKYGIANDAASVLRTGNTIEYDDTPLLNMKDGTIEILSKVNLLASSTSKYSFPTSKQLDSASQKKKDASTNEIRRCQAVVPTKSTLILQRSLENSNVFSKPIRIHNSTSCVYAFKVTCSSLAALFISIMPEMGLVPPHSEVSLNVATAKGQNFNLEDWMKATKSNSISVKISRFLSNDANELQQTFTTMERDYPDLVLTQTINKIILWDSEDLPAMYQMFNAIEDANDRSELKEEVRQSKLSLFRSPPSNAPQNSGLPSYMQDIILKVQTQIMACNENLVNLFEELGYVQNSHNAILCVLLMLFLAIMMIPQMTLEAVKGDRTKFL